MCVIIDPAQKLRQSIQDRLQEQYPGAQVTFGWVGFSPGNGNSFARIFHNRQVICESHGDTTYQALMRAEVEMFGKQEPVEQQEGIKFYRGNDEGS